MNRQETYNRVKSHLLTQNRRSMGEEGCAYRGDRGTTCAIGCLIPDTAYSPEFEGDSISFILHKPARHPLTDTLVDVLGVTEWQSDCAFLSRLQKVHDNEAVADWKNALERLAYEWDLEP